MPLNLESYNRLISITFDKSDAESGINCHMPAQGSDIHAHTAPVETLQNLAKPGFESADSDTLGTWGITLITPRGRIKRGTTMNTIGWLFSVS